MVVGASILARRGIRRIYRVCGASREKANKLEKSIKWPLRVLLLDVTGLAADLAVAGIIELCADHAIGWCNKDNDQEEDEQVAQNEPVPVDDKDEQVARKEPVPVDDEAEQVAQNEPVPVDGEDEQVAQNEPVPVDGAHPEVAACTGQIDDTFCVDNPAFEDMTPEDAYDQDVDGDDMLQDEVYDSGEEEEGDTDMRSPIST